MALNNVSHAQPVSGARRPADATGSHRRERVAVAVCAVVAGASHMPLIGEHLREAPYIGWSFVALVVASALAAWGLLRGDSRRVWAAVAVVYGVALLGYFLSRTVGLPQISDDIGNWTEPESFPAIASEFVALIFSVRVVLDFRRADVLGPDGAACISSHQG